MGFYDRIKYYNLMICIIKFDAVFSTFILLIFEFVLFFLY